VPPALDAKVFHNSGIFARFNARREKSRRQFFKQSAGMLCKLQSSALPERQLASFPEPDRPAARRVFIGIFD
jgi:hypothetical protein